MKNPRPVPLSVIEGGTSIEFLTLEEVAHKEDTNASRIGWVHNFQDIEGNHAYKHLRSFRQMLLGAHKVTHQRKHL